jgi:hypothetical protein
MMKKTILIGLILLIGVFIWADVYPIGTLGTSAAATYGPISGFYDYGWTKTIVTAAEMNAAGYDGTANIAGLGYYVGNTPSNYQIINVHCFIRHTTLSTYTTTADETGTAMPDSTLFTQVFSGTLTFNGGGWHYFSFNLAGFDWNGTSNIEIFWKNWDGDYVTGYPTYRYASTSPDYKLVYKQQDTTWPTTAGTRSTSRSNIAIVTPSDNPPNPAIAVYPSNNGWAFSNANLSWGDGGGMPTSYDLYLDTVNPPATLVGDDLTTTVFTPTLADNTTYFWQVIPRNANGEAENCPVWSFNTPAPNQMAESFDATTFPPTGWANPGTWSRSTTTPIFYGTASAYKSASTTPALLSTPILNITTGSNLDFYYRTSSTTGYGLMNIKYSSDRVTWNQIGSTISMPTTTDWNHASVSLNAIAGNNYYLAFEVLTSTSTSSIYVDHVFGPAYAAVAPGPATPTAPANAATGVSEYPVFTWTAPTVGGVPEGYRIYCDTNTEPTTLIGSVTGPGTLTWTSTVLLPFNTVHYWKVVPYNSQGEATGNTVWSFTTRQDPTIYALPWVEDFGTTGTTFPPTNWTRWSGVIATPSTLVANTSYWIQDNWKNDTTVTPVDFSARMNIYSTSRYGWIITPPIQMPGAGYQLEFDIALTDYASTNPITSDPNGTTGVDDKFIVLIGNGSTWTPANIVRQWDNAGSPYVYNDVPNTGMHVTLPLDSYNGIYYVAFYGESTVSNADNDFFVDNVTVRQTPAGLPDHVTLNSPLDGATGLDPENVILTWTPALTGGTPDYYEVYVGESPIDPGIGYYGEFFYETANTVFDLSAQTDITLAYGSTWYWAILPQTTGGAPDPEDPAFMVWDFTIAPDPTITTLPYAEYFDSVTVPALPWGWSSYINSTSTSAYVRTTTSYPVSSPNSVYLTNSTDSAADLRLISPPINLGRSLNQIKLKFYARSSTAGYPLLVGSVSATDGTGVFTQLQSITLTATQTEYTVSFADYLGTDQYICFKHGLGGTSRSLYIDNVSMIQLQPVDLAASALTGPGLIQAGVQSTYVVTVFNEGTAIQNSYDVNLKKHGDDMLASIHITDPLAPGASAQHTIYWTPSLGGNYQIYGEVIVAGDGSAINNITSEKSVVVVDATMTLVSVGDDATTTSAYYVPINLYYRNGVTEELYFTDEMHLQSGIINAIVYKNTSTNAREDKPIKIWMAQTAVTDLSGGWLPSANYTLVFDGMVDFPAGVNDIVIPLTTPYNFTGGTLATRVYRVFDSGAITSTEKFYYTTNAAHSTRSRYLNNDSTVYDPLAPSAAGTTLNYFPNTTFIVQNAILETGAILQGYVYEGATTNPVVGATVTLTERYATTTDENGFYRFTFWEAHNVNATASKTTYYSQTVNGIALTMGNTVTQNFNLNPMPRVTVSGLVNTNDIPGGTEGAAISLTGSESYNATSVVGGTFSIPNVLGSVDGLAYTIVVAKTGYPSYTSSVTVYATNLNLGTITLTENLWPAYNLVASHSGDNAQLVWDPAAEPDYMLFDFEADNGGWVGSGYGDWQWTNAYTLTGYVDGDTYVDTPPTAPHSGTGLWGTKVLGSYSNAAAWSYLRKTVDLSGFTNPVLSIWHYMNGYNTWDYGLIKVNGTTVWGSSALAVFMPWQQLTVDLSAYQGMSNVEISFEWYATSTVAYAGWYLDDIYIGPASSVPAFANRNGDRSLQNYSVYRMLAADEAIPANWILLNNAVTENTYTDTAFGAQAGGKYKWAVKANYSGSLQSEAIISNQLGRVYTPQEVQASQVGATVQLSWTAEAGADYYVIYACDDPYGTFNLLGYSATNGYTVNSPTARKFYLVTAADGIMPTMAPSIKAATK